MNIYLASRYSRIDELNRYKQQLEKLGQSVTSRWLKGEHQIHGADAFQSTRKTELDSPEKAALFAKDDVEDLAAADVVICFTEKPRAESTRGGRHVEFGMALALNKRLIVIGPRENVFHCLPEVEHWETWDAFFEYWGRVIKPRFNP